MSLGYFFKKNLMSFCIIVTCVSVVIGILGLIYEPNIRFGYEAFFSPFIFGIISIVPSIATYSKEELTFKQMVFRKILQFIILEFMIFLSVYIFGIIRIEMAISVALSVLLVFLMVHLVEWIVDCKRADNLNLYLKVFKENHDM